MMRTRLVYLLVGWTVLAAGIVVRTQDTTFSSRIEAVRVDVLVTDKGQPVHGLGPADFEIKDNGVDQQIDLVSFDQIPLNVILAFDMSDSVAGDRLDRLRMAGDAILTGLSFAFHSDVGLWGGAGVVIAFAMTRPLRQTIIFALIAAVCGLPGLITSWGIAITGDADLFKKLPPALAEKSLRKGANQSAFGHADGAQWLPSRADFFVPVKALSPIFRAKSRDTLARAGLLHLVDPGVWQRDWVVDSRAAGTRVASSRICW